MQHKTIKRLNGSSHGHTCKQPLCTARHGQQEMMHALAVPAAGRTRLRGAEAPAPTPQSHYNTAHTASISQRPLKCAVKHENRGAMDPHQYYKQHNIRGVHPPAMAFGRNELFAALSIATTLSRCCAVICVKCGINILNPSRLCTRLRMQLV